MMYTDAIPLLYFFLLVYLDKNLVHCEKVNCRARLFIIKVGLAMQYSFRFWIYVWIIKLELEDEASLNGDSVKLIFRNNSVRG